MDPAKNDATLTVFLQSLKLALPRLRQQTQGDGVGSGQNDAGAVSGAPVGTREEEFDPLKRQFHEVFCFRTFS